ncbi:hypothetical protein [Pseudomonas huanghezhanensis]|uniref:hypothetical protein n=1 Tax=Pseudomonas huanghezhanensis TaxID=3002903 RepID=UPI0022869957|nr:hypothetical protein [Pseudomonas sp. BSw22131]
MNTAKTSYPLPLVFVPSSDPEDGLLQTVDLSQPILVNVEVWKAAEPHYYAQLVLDDQLIGDARTITESDAPGDTMTFELPEKLLESNGIYKLAFRASSPFSEQHVVSESIELKVDRTPPGAAMLAPIIFPNVTLGEDLIGKIAGYSDMQIGDSIRTLCNGVMGPGHTVTMEETLEKPISIVFSRAYLEGLASESVLIEYFVTDRAGNVSVMSMPVVLTMNV